MTDNDAHADGVTIADWLETPGAGASLAGWLLDGDCDTDAQVLIDADGGVATCGDLRTLTLRLVSLFRASQMRAGKNTGAGDFSGQHRVMTVLPKGTGILASTLAALLSGSLLCLCEDDTAPETVAERLRDFEPDLVIAVDALWARAQGINGDDVSAEIAVCDDAGDLEPLLQSHEPATVLPAYDPDRAMLVVFTSGSDGKPKGGVLRAGILSEGSGLDVLAGIERTDRVAYLARWDALGVTDFIACLRGGAALCVPPDSVAGNPDATAQWIDDAGVSVLSAPTTIWAQCFHTRRWRDTPPAALRMGLFWGERIHRRVVADVLAARPDLELYNSYGATEASYISFGRLDLAAFAGVAGSPGGYPVAGVSVELPDAGQGRAGNPVVANPNTMLGYFHDLKAGRPENASLRIELQDNIRILPDGRIDVLGRSDSIIKLSGRRLSLTEIERAAETAQDVARAVAFATENEEAGLDIFVAVETRARKRADLAARVEAEIVRRVMPEAKPRQVHIVESFPVMPSGKVNRKALRASMQGGEAA